MSAWILVGDVLSELAGIPDGVVDTVVTSPPYWGLRDYGVAGQIGLEPTFAEHIAVMVDVFHEVRRVLKPTGTLWLNYGDTYASSPNGRSAAATKATGNDDRTFRDKPFSTIGGVLKSKDLCGIPWRLALALQEDGWWLRQDIIWSKPNPMPESIKDRCTKAHEYLFLLAKSERYYFDAEAMKEPAAYAGPNSPGSIKSPYGQGFTRRARGTTPRHAAHDTNHLTLDAAPRGLTRHKRSVWTVATKPFKDAHFATFPPELIEPCIAAGAPPGGIVLDPFGGAGTTGLVAQRLGRRSILIELNPTYAEMARARIAADVEPDFMQ